MTGTEGSCKRIATGTDGQILTLTNGFIVTAEGADNQAFTVTNRLVLAGHEQTNFYT